ncbi:MAG: AEC family transporter [Magnetovibrionaceae bacterium]
MVEIFVTIGPVFLLIAVGYASVRSGLFPATGIAGLITFVNTFAVPCLLFQAMLHVDFESAFDPGYLASFYIGAVVVYAAGALISRRLFKRRPGEASVIAFAGYFTNTVLVGLPIIDRAFGEGALPLAYAIIGFHAPLLMSLGTVLSEWSRRDGEPLGRAFVKITKRILANPLLIGIALGAAANLSGLGVPAVINDATEMLAIAVLPTALFGLGGALNEYKLRESWAEALVASVLKLVIHPLCALVLAVFVFQLPQELARVAVLMAAMPAGLNVYVFAFHYQRCTDVAANTVLISTILSALSVSAWLMVLDLISLSSIRL